MKWSDFMKTKSKRFLNLATLCLALLGTTLLMAHPVKAEAVRQNVEQTEGKVTQEGGSRDRSVIEEEGRLYENSYDEGLQKGYEEGEKSDTRDLDRDKIEVPDSLDDTGYKDGFERGYADGWRNTHPVEAFLENVWGYLVSIFHGWFSSGTNSR
ncbi:hypothetical protein B7R59_05850 [Streptococcus pyogenes]|nr:hypothetical protein B7R59_05850 [Streptococcus pyogenes]